jgi:Ca2+-binding RTX toxin-like protein
MTGDQGDDYLSSDSGDDWLVGASGSDVLYGWFGDDSVYGGDGNDFLRDLVEPSAGGNYLDCGAGDDDGGDWNNPVLVGCENLSPYPWPY